MKGYYRLPFLGWRFATYKITPHNREFELVSPKGRIGIRVAFTSWRFPKEKENP